MIIEVTEFTFKGITLYRVDGKGWKCTLDEKEYLFPTCQDAQSAISEIFSDIQPVISKHGGVKLPKKK